MQRKRALNELIVALQVAIRPDNKARYEFLVFNVSVEAWKIIRPFLRIGRAKYFVEEITSIATSLQDLTKVDADWLTTFYGGAAFCLTDHGDGKGASEMLDKAVVLAEVAVADVVALEETNQEGILRLSKEVEEFHREIHVDEAKLDTVLMERQKRVAGDEDEDGGGQEQGGEEEGEEEALRTSLAGLHEQMLACQATLGTLKDEAKAVVERKLPLVDRVTRLYMQRIHAHPEDGKRFAATPEVGSKNIRVKCLAQLHCMQAGCIPAGDCLAAMKNMIADLEKETPTPQVILQLNLLHT